MENGKYCGTFINFALNFIKHLFYFYFVISLCKHNYCRVISVDLNAVDPSLMSCSGFIRNWKKCQYTGTLFHLFIELVTEGVSNVIFSFNLVCL